MPKKKPNGYVLYKGPSQLDESPIVVILTGVQRPSANPKTGWLCQSWIVRSDMHPMEAIRTNSDTSICGSCPLKGDGGRDRVCYVNLAGPGQIYKSFLAGQYPLIENSDFTLFKHRAVRLGSYGDPAACPYEIWDRLIRASAFHTGYTSQWRDGTIDPRFKQICMASCISAEEQHLAAAQGWRTYRVRTANDPVLKSEIICPASEERDYEKTCMTCGLCAGASKSGANITIQVHGGRAGNFKTTNLTQTPLTDLEDAATFKKTPEYQLI